MNVCQQIGAILTSNDIGRINIGVKGSNLPLNTFENTKKCPEVVHSPHGDRKICLPNSMTRHHSYMIYQMYTYC